MKAQGAAICVGTVHHQRSTPVAHGFSNTVAYAWLDPDRPDELTAHHWAWSDHRPAPVRFRRRDYGLRGTVSLADEVRDDLAPVLGRRVDGEVRMLTQLRQLGWLFNPITLFFAWDDDLRRPIGAVLEVTNTPWKERHRYPVGLAEIDGLLEARFDKVLHVSPFLAEHFRYLLTMADRDDRIVIDLAVLPHAGDAPQIDGRPADPVLTVHLDLVREPADQASLAASMRAVPLSTHRVSAAIHAQAIRLWRRHVPFVAHPSKRPSPEVPK